MPRLGRFSGSTRERWTRYSYEEFANKVVKDNADVVFTMLHMDEAFRFVDDNMPKTQE